MAEVMLLRDVPGLVLRIKILGLQGSSALHLLGLEALSLDVGLSLGLLFLQFALSLFLLAVSFVLLLLMKSHYLPPHHPKESKVS